VECGRHLIWEINNSSVERSRKIHRRRIYSLELRFPQGMDTNMRHTQAFVPVLLNTQCLGMYGFAQMTWSPWGPNLTHTLPRARRQQHHLNSLIFLGSWWASDEFINYKPNIEFNTSPTGSLFFYYIAFDIRCRMSTHFSRSQPEFLNKK
jgi:hypothetical protein